MPSKEDIEKLKTRINPDNEVEFIDALKIFPTNKLTNSENIKKLKTLNEPVFEIKSDESRGVSKSDNELFGFL